MPQPEATVGSTAPSKSCGCTEGPSFKIPTRLTEEFLAAPFIDTAVDLGLLVLTITFLHRCIGIEIEYFLWPIFIGLLGATLKEICKVFREDARKEKEKNMKIITEYKERQAESGLQHREVMLKYKQGELEQREQTVELKEQEFEDKAKTWQAKLEKAKAIATRMKNLDPSDRGLHWLREAEKEAGLEFVRKTMQ